MKCLAIDFGEKKSGLAISDDTASIAIPFAIVPTINLERKIQEILETKKITHIIIGESVNSKGEHNKVFEETKSFMQILKEKYCDRISNKDLEIVLEKEFFTSKHARQEDGRKDIDDRAAALILQRFLDRDFIKRNKK
jgi:putative Holliday junction resolvase